MKCETCGQYLPDEQKIRKILESSGFYDKIDIRPPISPNDPDCDFYVKFTRTTKSGCDCFIPSTFKRLHAIDYLITCCAYWPESNESYMFLKKIPGNVIRSTW